MNSFFTCRKAFVFLFHKKLFHCNLLYAKKWILILQNNYKHAVIFPKQLMCVRYIEYDIKYFVFYVSKSDFAWNIFMKVSWSSNVLLVGGRCSWSVVGDGFKGDSINEYCAIFEFHLQSWTKLRETLVFMWNRALREIFNFYFSGAFS